MHIFQKYMPLLVAVTFKFCFRFALFSQKIAFCALLRAFCDFTGNQSPKTYHKYTFFSRCNLPELSACIELSRYLLVTKTGNQGVSVLSFLLWIIENFTLLSF